MSREKLSIQSTIDKKEKDYILEVYKRNSINMAARVLNMIREDVKRLGGEK